MLGDAVGIAAARSIDQPAHPGRRCRDDHVTGKGASEAAIAFARYRTQLLREGVQLPAAEQGDQRELPGPGQSEISVISDQRDAMPGGFNGIGKMTAKTCRTQRRQVRAGKIAGIVFGPRIVARARDEAHRQARMHAR